MGQRSNAQPLGELQRVQAWLRVLGLCGRCAWVPVPGRGSLCRQGLRTCMCWRVKLCRVSCARGRVCLGAFGKSECASSPQWGAGGWGLVRVCGCADVCLCSVPRRVDTAVGLCVRMCACVARAPPPPPAAALSRLCGRVGSVWVHCVESVCPMGWLQPCWPRVSVGLC